MNNIDLDALDQGVFVIPYKEESSTEAGPSKTPRRELPGSLKGIYENSLSVYRNAYQQYENDRTSEQLDDIADWLEDIQYKKKERRDRWFRIHVAILQNASRSLADSLHTTVNDLRVIQLHGRDVNDLGSGLRSIAQGLLGDEYTAKSGRTPMDEVERWWKGIKTKPFLLLYINQAQLVPSQILAEIIYILTLHPSLPFNLLLSVPSTSTFLDSWSPIELSSIDLNILQSTNRSSRKGGAGAGAVGAILRARSDSDQPMIRVSDDLADELRKEDEMFGIGPEGVLKAIQWDLLRHSHTSALADLADVGNDMSDQRLAAAERIIDDMNGKIEINKAGRALFELSSNTDRNNITDPSPRLSILHALSAPTSYTSRIKPKASTVAEKSSDGIIDISPKTSKKTSKRQSSPESPSTPRRSSKRRKRIESPTDEVLDGPLNNETNGVDHDHDHDQSRSNGVAEDEIIHHNAAGSLGDLQNLFELWKSAGRNINLWDWLDGFKMMSTSRNRIQQDDAPQTTEASSVRNGESPDNLHAVRQKGKEKMIINGTDHDLDDDDDQEEDQQRDERDNRAHRQEDGATHDDIEQRHHATFVRFVEEARMLGLVRAKGKGVRKGADEVVKGIGVV